MIKNQFHWIIALIAIVLAATYWFHLAHDRYVSKAIVVLDSPEIAPPDLSFSAMLSGGQNTQDLLLLREYMLSTDMLNTVLEELDFIDHYHQNGDVIAKLRDPNAPLETLHEYFLKWVEVELDDRAGVLVIEAQAFSPEFAHDLVQLLMRSGESHMNDMGQRLADEQVIFLERQTDVLAKRLDETRERLLDYQNEHGLVSPTATVESINQVVATLEGELARLQARRNAISSFQSEQSSEMVRVHSEIQALRDQIKEERERLAQASGISLNRISAEYQMLELQAEFALGTYSAALSALESTRIEAARKLKQVSVLQSPTRPEYALEPRAVYYTSVFALVTLLLALVAHMLKLIIRDHRD